MSEPERWLTSTEAPSGMSEMLSAAQKVGPSAVERAALAGKLGVATSGLWIAPALKGLAATVVVAGGIWGATNLGGAPEEAPSAVTPPSTSEPGTPTIELDEPPLVPDADAQRNEEPPEQVVQPSPSAKRAPQKASAPEGEPAKPSEASMIARAKGALETSPSKALAALAEHAKLYPKGVLAEEREVLRIRALKNLGRDDAAEAQQEKFRKEHPESVHHIP